VATVLVTLLGCVDYPETYAPPVQRKAMAGPDTSGIGYFVTMTDPNATAYFVSGIYETLEGNSFRWTGQRPTLRFVLTTVKHLKFVMDFGTSDATMAQTGPLTISYYVNGRLLDKVRYDTAGAHHFEKAVDPSWLEAGGDTLVSAELDKVWVSPEDGGKLGITLSRAGFMQ
jgi:hypothetical protein